MNFPPSKNAMDPLLVKPKIGIVYPTLKCPTEILLDVRLTTYRQPRKPPVKDARFLANCPNPGLMRVHGVWIVYMDSSNGDIISIRDSFGPDFNKLIAEEELIVCDQLTEEELQHCLMLWFDNTKSGVRYIASQGLKHGSLCIGNRMKGYYRTAFDLTFPFFNGGEKDIRNVFRKHGIELGKYCNGFHVRDILKEEYGYYPCLSFNNENGHPVSNDVSFLYAVDTHASPHHPPKPINHPNY